MTAPRADSTAAIPVPTARSVSLAGASTTLSSLPGVQLKTLCWPKDGAANAEASTNARIPAIPRFFIVAPLERRKDSQATSELRTRFLRVSCPKGQIADSIHG